MPALLKPRRTFSDKCPFTHQKSERQKKNDFNIENIIICLINKTQIIF